MTSGMAPHDGEMERRVSSLEKSFGTIDAKLDRLIENLRAFQQDTGSRLTRIETMLETKASAAEVADLRGTVRVLPTIWQLITLVFGILAGAFAILRFGLPHP